MILTYIAKKVPILIHLNVFINFCTQIFYKFYKRFPYESPESKFDFDRENVKVNPRSSLEHFWVKIFKTYHEILCSRILMFDLDVRWVKVIPRSVFQLSWYYSSTRCCISNFKGISPLVPEKKTLKVLTINRHSGHVGHVTWTV